MLVFTNSTNVKTVNKMIERGSLIKVPSNDVVDKMQTSYDNSEQSGKENGFIVGKTGKSSIIVEGKEKQIEKEWEPARKDLANQGDTPGYDVHVHPLALDKGEYGLPKPSDTDMKNILGNQPNVVLGYDERTVDDSGTSATSSYGKEIKKEYIKQIGFFNSKGNIAKPMDFIEFKDVTKKINDSSNGKP
jgi:hypothetical protein